MSLNIYQRINEVRKSVRYVKKDANVSTGKGAFKAVTHDQVTAALRGAMVEQGIVTTQSLEKSTIEQAGQTKTGAIQRIINSTFKVSFINIDDPQDRVEIMVEAQAIDTSDKLSGKASSYAMKYALLKTFNLETGENDESRQESFKRAEEHKDLVDNQQIKAIEKLIKSTGTVLKDAVNHYGAESLEAMNQTQRADLHHRLSAKAKKQEQK